MWAIELPVPYADSVRDACFETGLIINAARPHILRFMPSLRVEENEIASMLDVLDTALAKVLVASSPMAVPHAT